ncbi:MAG TPA: hypothetical protein VK027_09850 [Chitinophagaceae bacterium]|nr:hypothetical protein [Chitinophagaceae bacterium]
MKNILNTLLLGTLVLSFTVVSCNNQEEEIEIVDVEKTGNTLSINENSAINFFY